LEEIMTDADRKRLTEFLGGCWHEKGDKIGELGVYCCKKCRTAFHRQLGFRTFATPADALDTMNRLVEKGKWEEFGEWAGDQWDRSKPFIYWLFSPDSSGIYRICELAGEFIKERG
jgi:hypothetical protein